MTQHSGFGIRAAIILSFLMAFQPINVALAATYYVDSGRGDDANDGLSPSSAWRTLNKVNSFVEESGDDVLLKSGSVFEDQILTVDWSGTPANWTTVDCYTVDPSGRPGSCSASDKRPEINGTFEPSCAAVRRCILESSNSVPKTIGMGLVNVSVSYFSLKNLTVRDSAGNPIILRASEESPRSHFLIEDVNVEHTVRRVLLVGPYFSQGVIRRVEGKLYGLCESYKYEECSGPGWSGGIVVFGSPRAMIVMEDSYVSQGSGEGFNCLRSSHVVMRNNRAGSIRSARFYLDNCSEALVENNIAWGGGSDTDARSEGRSGVAVSTEDYNGPDVRGSENIVIRNNLMVGLGSCISAGQLPAAVLKGLKIGFYAYGNTCVGTTNDSVSIRQSVKNIATIAVQDNIFFSPDSTYSPCQAPVSPSVKFSHNLWDRVGSRNECVGVGDIIGDPMLATPLQDMLKLNDRNQPDPSDFALRNGTPVVGRGFDFAQLNRTAMSNLSFVSQVHDGKCGPDANLLIGDYHCSDRETPPSIGAIERIKYPPKPPIIEE